MSSTLWIGIISIVCVLELVRIALSTYVLLHILDSRQLRRQDEQPGQATRSLRSASFRARREELLDPTLLALRGAMDEVSRGRSGIQVERAIRALDDYALLLTGTEERR
jgi:hypothetical protein